jgi:hypothetical protein
VTRVGVTDRLVTGWPPTVTVVAPERLVPMIVSAVFPASGPPEGVTAVIVGTPWCVNPLGTTAVPPGVATETLFTPAAPGGLTQVSEVSLATTTPVADAVPNRTAVVPVSPVPVIVTGVPPDTGPTLGDTLDIVGAGWKYMNPPASALVPPGVVTDTTLAPPEPGGTMAARVPSSTSTSPVAGTPPTSTDDAALKPDPVTVMTVPPPTGPESGATADTTGTGL